jgi:hypothetical protein
MKFSTCSSGAVQLDLASANASLLIYCKRGPTVADADFTADKENGEA